MLQLVPARASFPIPGQDALEAPWLKYLKRRSVVLFLFDAKSCTPLTTVGKKITHPLEEAGMMFSSRFEADLSSKGCVTTDPNVLACMYDHRGLWLETRSREGLTVRNPGLGLAWLLLQFPIAALVGTIALWCLWWIAAGRNPWPADLESRVAFVVAGLVLGGILVLIRTLARLGLYRWKVRPALAPLGSTERKVLYRQLAKQPDLLLVEEVELEVASIDWPDQQKYESWCDVLTRHGFSPAGQYKIERVGVEIEFWTSSAEQASIITGQNKMWLSVEISYADGTTFEVTNKDASGLDQAPFATIVYLGFAASAEEVIRIATLQRPPVGRITPDPTTVVESFKRDWKRYMEWRKRRGTTAEEYEKVEQLSNRRKV